MYFLISVCGKGLSLVTGSCCSFLNSVSCCSFYLEAVVLLCGMDTWKLLFLSLVWIPESCCSFSGVDTWKLLFSCQVSRMLRISLAFFVVVAMTTANSPTFKNIIKIVFATSKKSLDINWCKFVLLMKARKWM